MPIPFWYSHVEVLVKAVVTADVEPFLMEYTFGVHVFILCSFIILLTDKHLLNMLIIVCIIYVQITGQLHFIYFYPDGSF